MVFLFTPGNALGCNVNSHRLGWNGSVCREASAWNCSAEQRFRDDYCAAGDDRCYHIHLFDAKSPRFTIDDNGAGWMLGADAHALDDQILVVWGGDFAEPRGLREGASRGPVYGAYRVKACRRLSLPFRDVWEVTPHADGWVRIHNLRVSRPVHRSLNGKYLREVDRVAVTRLFDDAAASAKEQADPKWFDARDAERLQVFHEHLDEWFDIARKAADGRGYGVRDTVRVRYSSGPQPTNALAGIPTVVKPRAEQPPTRGPGVPLVEAAAASPPPAPITPAAVAAPPTWIETGAEQTIAAAYGSQTLLALRIAALSKTLLVLRGDTGVGKSTLATSLLDDPKRERTLVVPVAATWRGREDLLGYVNPIHGEFEPTPFTVFAAAAWQAWTKGDRRKRVVVFEEFNLAQPEHWMSDVLVVSQYQSEVDRVVNLGGKSIRGIDQKGTALHLSPELRFVATMNTDHTVRTLSPRVLDRAAVVELTMEPDRAMQLVGVTLADDLLLPIRELHQRLQGKGATFSLRTARSLAACLAGVDALEVTPLDVVDQVLIQDLLSKVGLLARDPSDELLAAQLKEWSERHGKLRRSAQTIERWLEDLQAGIDVAQA